MRMCHACLLAVLVPALSCAALVIEPAFASQPDAASRFKDVPPDGNADAISGVTVTPPKPPASPSAPLVPDVPMPSAPSVAVPSVASPAGMPSTNAAPRATDPVSQALQFSQTPAGTAGNQVPIAAIDTTEGYAAQVMEKILPYWQPPAGVSGVVTVSMQIGSNGRLLYCETIKPSGNSKLDESPCQAALKVSSFGNPPYGAISKVYLTLATDRSALGVPAAANKAAKPEPGYAENLMNQVRPHVQVPKGLKGSYTLEIALQVSSKGGIEQISISRSSGRPDVDNAVLAALCTPGILPPFSDGMPSRSLQLLFTVKGN